MSVVRGWGLWLAGVLTICLLGATLARGQTGAAAPAGAEAALVGAGIQERPGAAWDSRQGVHGDDGFFRSLIVSELYGLSR